MVININIILEGLGNMLKSVFQIIAKLISGLSSDFGLALLLIISVGLAWFLINSYEKTKLSKWVMIVIISLLIFLLFQFSMGV